MKLILFLLSLQYSATTQVDMQNIRDLFAVSHLNEKANNQLIEITANYSMLSNPIMYAYHASGIMSKANYTLWPTTKLSYFNEGKKMLEQVIAKFPNETELRFIRYNVQHGAPSFLGYSNSLEEDKQLILKGIDQLNWSAAYKKEIKDYLKSN